MNLPDHFKKGEQPVSEIPPEDRDLFHLEEGDESWIALLQEVESSAVQDRLGSFENIEEVGRGGQGIVYRARLKGANQPIAVKRLLAGSLASPAMQRRFQRELEAMQALHHPTIVTVYGMTFVEDLPLLTMEWVEGSAIGEWAAAQRGSRLGDQRILRLFMRVCEGVHHAHQKGILHRDLKPSNLLVDATGCPRILDFGLAKPLQAGPEEGSEITRSGGFLGTPAYASPELLRDGAGHLDVRSDVYALGLVLFEMLTGEPMFSQSGSSLAVLQERQDPKNTRLARLRPDLSRDLQWIVQKAVAPDLDQRYQSVDAFGADLQRFLNGEAVLAHPPSTWYQLRKILRRNPPATALAAVLLIAVLAFVGVTLWQAQQVKLERDDAIDARNDESQARAEAEAQRRSADRAQQQSEAALQFLLEDVLGATDPYDSGPELPLRYLLKLATQKVDQRFTEDPMTERQVRHSLAKVLFSLGDYVTAREQARAALKLAQAQDPVAREAIASSAWTLGRILQRLGEYRDSEVVLRLGLRSLAPAPAASPADSQNLTLRLKAQLASTLLDLRELDESQDLFEECLASIKDRGQEDPSFHAVLNQYALGWLTRGDWQRARELLQRLIDVEVARFGQHYPGLIALLSNLAVVDRSEGQLEAAEANLRRALQIDSRLARGDHPERAEALGNLAHVLAQQYQLEEAERVALEAHGIMQRLGAGESLTAAVLLNRLAVVYYGQKRLVESEEYCRRSLQMHVEQLGEDHPESWALLCNLLDVNLAQGDEDQAEELLVRALDVLDLADEELLDRAAGLRLLISTHRHHGRPEVVAELEEMLDP